MNAGFIGDIRFKLVGTSSEAIVSLQNTTAGQKFVAVTNTASKSFKTFKGAERWMAERGYQKI